MAVQPLNPGYTHFLHSVVVSKAGCPAHQHQQGNLKVVVLSPTHRDVDSVDLGWKLGIYIFNEQMVLLWATDRYLKTTDTAGFPAFPFQSIPCCLHQHLLKATCGLQFLTKEASLCYLQDKFQPLQQSLWDSPRSDLTCKSLVISCHLSLYISSTSGFPCVSQLVKNPPAMWETWVWSLSWEDPLEKGKAIHSSILAQRIPWTTCIVHGAAKSRTRLNDFHFHFTSSTSGLLRFQSTCFISWFVAPYTYGSLCRKAFRPSYLLAKFLFSSRSGLGVSSGSCPCHLSPVPRLASDVALRILQSNWFVMSVSSNRWWVLRGKGQNDLSPISELRRDEGLFYLLCWVIFKM